MLAERYERQIALPEIGEAGQARLLASSALVVGCGGLGSTLLYCLCGMGVGRIGFCDGDVVSASNLNRQFLYTPADVGRKKTEAAHKRLRAFAPEPTLEPLDAFVTPDNAPSLVSRYDVVLLAVDAIPARLAVNHACVEAGVPLVDAGVDGFHGSLFTVRPGKTACLGCLYSASAPEQPAVPSFAPIVSVVASLQAQCAANILLNLPNPTDGRMLLFDGAAMATEFVTIARNPRCPICGK
ncbi:MAG: HesA/MoeB/ThiF family protein [Clostridiales bacterium]|nr:HesA/MoeB/ThiF family protein [Clostridiales bacterium]